ncbi:protein NipSnap-like isoform X1 [Tachypleus tridentatus]|uniref:protein NipSnap-like isoform X1 n=1 Tax=Tachypleus tridentatus TaxID=6853 RepID=UPI003FD22C73
MASAAISSMKIKWIPRFSSLISRNISISQANKANEGWWNKFLHVRTIDPGKDSHSRLLSDSDLVYELQIHDVKPSSTELYLKDYEQWVHSVKDKVKDTSLVGSWKVLVGDQDELVHIWRYDSYTAANKAMEMYRTDPELRKLKKERVKFIRRQENQLMLAFSFWGHPKARNWDCNYEMRSYILKPGTMIEWGNIWARAITYRKKNHAVAGFFSQIGQLYMVHHIWGYKDLQVRKEVREEVWRNPGWDECVAHTVPLVREMRSRWLTPNSFSPIL